MEGENKKKRTWLWDSLVIAGGVLGIGGLLWFIYRYGMALLGGMLLGFMLAWGETDELLFTTTSPGGEYVLEAVRENTPAIEPYYVKVNLLDGDDKRVIYYVRGQEEAEILWLSDTVAQINGVPVDVTTGECFKANARGYLDVIVFVEAVDVKRVHLTALMGGEERLSRVGKIVYDDEKNGQRVRMRLNVLQELHWDDDLSAKKAGLTCTAETLDGQMITLPYLWEWTAKEYGNYQFTLTGSKEAGYMLAPGAFECKAVAWSGESVTTLVNSFAAD